MTKNTQTNTASTNLIDVGPSRVAHRVSGKGPDVIFIHGWPLHGATWRRIVPHFERTFRCHVFDLPGTGQSEWSAASPLTIRGHTAAIVEAIRKLGIERTALAGHDSGGAIARLVAAELGERCTGLVIGNTEIPGYHPPLLQLLILASKLSGGGRLLPLILRTPFLRRSPIGFGGCFEDPRFADGEFGRLFLDPIVGDRRVAAGQLGMLGNFDWAILDAMASTHARITAPVALLWGADDPWFPLGKVRPMVTQFRKPAELHEIAGGKLFVHEEQPHEWARLAHAFLERAARTSPAVSAGAA